VAKPEKKGRARSRSRGSGRPRRTGAAKDPAARRSRFLFAGALAFSAVVLVAWFPASSLLHQRTDLAGTSGQLAALHKQDAALAQEKKNLSDAGEIGRIAREQYQLVDPGQRAYEVLPPSGAAAAGTTYAGDPGSTGPAAPSATPELPPGAVTTTTTPNGRAGHAAPSAPAASSGLLTRMLHSLEFWR
jgi:cell division protein FtsB